MKSRKNRAKVAVPVLALAGLVVFSLIGYAGDLDPPAPPAPTMHTLDEIYDAVTDASCGVAEREGCFMSHYVASSTPKTFFTVPAGKCFVLLRAMVYHHDLKLTVNDDLFWDGIWFGAAGGEVDEEFPDRCLVVKAGETLKVTSAGMAGPATIIGYFYDVE